jgi:hypothetical protein
MLKNRKTLSVFLIGLFMFLAYIANAAQQEKKVVNNSDVKAKKLLEINKRSQLLGYVIKDNTLYLGIWIDTDGKQGKSFVYKYENGRLKDMKMSEKEADDFIETNRIPKTDDLEKQKLEIKDGKYLILRVWAEAINFYNLYIYDGKEERNMTNDRYLAYLIGNYIYIDKENEKIYFDVWNRSKYIDKDKKEKQEEESGMFIYDIRADKFEFFKGIKSEQDKEGNEVIISCINPIRVPNTEYLMYIADKKTSYVKNDSLMNTGLEVWIQEIPEWKEELEAKEKDKNTDEIKSDENKSAEVKYVIDGPANLREKAKGKKVVGELADKAEVKILNKKGDWYEVESGEIKGWTYKDNVKEE